MVKEKGTLFSFNPHWMKYGKVWSYPSQWWRNGGIFCLYTHHLSQIFAINYTPSNKGIPFQNRIQSSEHERSKYLDLLLNCIAPYHIALWQMPYCTSPWCFLLRFLIAGLQCLLLSYIASYTIAWNCIALYPIQYLDHSLYQ